MVKAADMLIARRADTRARADFATWKMMAKLNGASALPAEAQTFLGSYKALLGENARGRRDRATINLMYKAYYAEMGGVGTPPDFRPRQIEQVTDNVTAFKRPPPPKTAPVDRASRIEPKAPASGGADLCLPGRGLCRHPVFLAVTAAG